MATEKYRLFFGIHARSKETEEQEQEKDYVTIGGKAVTFNDETLLFRDSDGTPVYEQIDRKALDNTDMDDVLFDLNHDWDRSIPLARTRNKSLTLEKRDDGLYFEAKIQKSNEDGMKVYRAVQSGLLDKCSFAFTLDGEEGQDITYREGEGKTGSIHIVVKNIDKLFDVSAVSIPAYDNTSLGARSAMSRTAKDVETFRASVETDRVAKLKKRLLARKF